MKKSEFLFIFLLVLPLTYSYAQLGTTGKFHTLFPIPNPVTAGEKIIFRANILNQSMEAWLKESYFTEAEIYDINKNYIGRTEKNIGGAVVSPGGTVSIDISFIVPPNYSGPYYYKVFLTQKGNRVTESDFQEFNVNGIQGKTAGWKPQWLGFNGQMTLSLRNTDRNNWRNFVGNASFNGAANLFKGKTELAFDNFLTSKSTSSETIMGNVENRIYNLLFKNAGRNYVFALGDVVPSFSPLSLYGRGMRGAYLNSYKFNTEIILTRISEPQEASNGFTGVFERWVWGARTKYDILPAINLGANYIAGEDNANSISFSTSNVMPQRGRSYGITLDYKPSRHTNDWGASSELMFSELNTNIQMPQTNVISDYAYRIEVSRSSNENRTAFWYLETRPDFKAIGSPGIQNDRKIFDISENIMLTQKMETGIGYNQWNDNVLNDASKLTTTQKTYRFNTKYIFEKPWPSLSAIYFFNEAAANDLSKQDNFTSNFNIILRSEKDKMSWGTDFQQVNYIDKTGLADNLLTRKIGFNAKTPVFAKVTAELGLSLTRIENLVKIYSDLIQSYSTSIFWNTFPGRFSIQFGVDHTIERNDTTDMLQKIDLYRTDTITEFSFAVKRDLTLVIGAILNFKTDNINSSNCLTEKGMSAKVIVNF